MFIYFWERKGGAEREGDTESQEDSRLWAVSTEPNTGLEPMNCEIMTWADVRCSTDWATQAPPAFTNFLWGSSTNNVWESDY